MMSDDETVERVARALAAEASTTEMGAAGFNAIHRKEYVEICWRDHEDRARAALSAMPHAALLREALAYAHQLEQCVAEFLDAYTAFNNDELDEVSMNDAEHGMKLAMYAFREARAAADKIRAALTQEKQT